MKNYNILQKLCKRIFYVGFGNLWFENGVLGDENSIPYRIYFYISFSLYGFLTLLEVMAALFADFPEDEKRDSVTFSVAHTIVMIKMFSIIVNKKNIKKLISDIIAVCETHEEESLMNEKYKVMKINVIAYFFTCYSSAACFVFEGLRKMYEGNHFVTVVTYYPAFEDNSAMATATRFITTIILFIMLMAMIISVDGFTMVILIMFKYKLITLRNYFDKLRKDTEILHQSSDPQLAVNHLVNGLIKGIIMHKELLRILKEIDKAFGTVVALQLCQSSGGAVSLLLGIALSDQLTLVAIMKIIFFVVALFFLLGLFLCNAGEITYQASLLSESIFYCGWHTCSLENSRGRNIRRIVLHACIQAQRPLVMKAFKMIELTYGTFLWVLRGTYSVFALFYAQNK
ncbi:uncharacterized protein LOC116768051 [Danaus plexippus]|uniref:uncharacterized protein LOC116768051 n=1 Tax=Danaus plexippus TaxID=13037 RepID=UPI002AB2E5DC|nr:uncharacterized protein LOC116768051 [Danaus plexippus]